MFFCVFHVGRWNSIQIGPTFPVNVLFRGLKVVSMLFVIWNAKRLISLRLSPTFSQTYLKIPQPSLTTYHEFHRVSGFFVRSV
ncbi:hypothetical protein Y032_0061g3286 [Ancylostoma ceylanicum]|uniref:Uncharacterized protein n=1 Tax=Ancylostoma ceylanicum TaxID=53326 RepID=A0A016U1Z4_9BILA|nr:hypothetical protein Y032_0061g3286 [Ancylostoma ceylanicum]